MSRRWFIVLLFSLIFLGLALANAHAQYREEYCIRCSTINALAWNPKGDLIAAGASDGLWLYGSDGRKVERLTDNSTDEVAWNADGTLLAESHGPAPRVFPENRRSSFISIWNIADRRVQRQLRAITTHATFSWSPKGDILAYANGTGMNFWDATANRVREAGNLEFVPRDIAEHYGSMPGSLGSILRIAWGPDGTTIALNTTGRLLGEDIESEDDDQVLIWNVQTEMIERRFNARASPNEPLIWNASGTKLLSGDGIFNAYTGETDSEYLNRSGISHYGLVGVAAWGPDDQSFVTDLTKNNNQGFYLVIWDTTTWQVKAELFTEHKDRISALAWAPDGQWIASGGKDGEIWLTPVKNS